MASMTGINSLPSAERAYSTEGGEVGATSRLTTPLVSSSRSRAVSILGEMPRMSLLSSPKRRGPPLNCQMTLVVHAPPSKAIQVPMGQPGGGGGALLLRTLCGMGAPYREVSGFLSLPKVMSYTKVSGSGNFVAV